MPQNYRNLQLSITQKKHIHTDTHTYQHTSMKTYTHTLIQVHRFSHNTDIHVPVHIYAPTHKHEHTHTKPYAYKFTENRQTETGDSRFATKKTEIKPNPPTPNISQKI